MGGGRGKEEDTAWGERQAEERRGEVRVGGGGLDGDERMRLQGEAHTAACVKCGRGA